MRDTRSQAQAGNELLHPVFFSDYGRAGRGMVRGDLLLLHVLRGPVRPANDRATLRLPHDRAIAPAHTGADSGWLW